MTKLILTVTLDYDAELMHGNDPVSLEWFMRDVLGAEEGLFLHSNEVGDEVGKILVIDVRATK